MNIKIASGFFAVTLILIGITARAEDIPLPVCCVVNGDKFSDHKREPIHVTYNGRTIPVCCANCARKFEKNPEKYIKLYDAAIKAAATPAK